MGDLEKLIDRSTINFPNLLNENQVEEFFEYLAKNSIKVKYNSTFSGIMMLNDSGELYQNKNCLEISGTMREINSGGNSSFECPTKIMGKNTFEGIRFQTTPGYDLEDHNLRDVKLWAKVRGLTQEYFSKYKE